MASLLRLRLTVPVDRLAAERSVLRRIHGRGRVVESVKRRRVARRPVLLQLHRVRQAECIPNQRVELLGLVQLNTLQGGPSPGGLGLVDLDLGCSTILLGQ